MKIDSKIKRSVDGNEWEQEKKAAPIQGALTNGYDSDKHRIIKFIQFKVELSRVQSSSGRAWLIEKKQTEPNKWIATNNKNHAE